VLARQPARGAAATAPRRRPRASTASSCAAQRPPSPPRRRRPRRGPLPRTAPRRFRLSPPEPLHLIQPVSCQPRPALRARQAESEAQAVSAAQHEQKAPRGLPWMRGLHSRRLTGWPPVRAGAGGACGARRASWGRPRAELADYRGPGAACRSARRRRRRAAAVPRVEPAPPAAGLGAGAARVRVRGAAAGGRFAGCLPVRRVLHACTDLAPAPCTTAAKLVHGELQDARLGGKRSASDGDWQRASRLLGRRSCRWQSRHLNNLLQMRSLSGRPLTALARAGRPGRGA